MSDESRADRLTELRDRLAGLLEHADERSTPALAKEYRTVLAELEKLGPKESSSVDDLAARRAARLSEPKGSDEAAARGRGGRAGGDRSR